jgi:hypothetical protein
VGLAPAQAQDLYLEEPFYWDQNHGTRVSRRALLEEQRTHRKFASMTERELAAISQVPRLGDDWTVAALTLVSLGSGPGQQKGGAPSAVMLRAIVGGIARSIAGVGKVTMSICLAHRSAS